MGSPRTESPAARRTAPAASAPLGRRWSKRLGALLVGLVATFFLLEIGLQIAAAFVTPQRRLADLAPKPGERRILCIGDSFTYGSHVPWQESYPGRLQEMLERVEGNPWKVINLGYPGQNSAQVRLGLARNFDVYEPEIVICLVGANNTWSRAQGHLWEHPHSEPEAEVHESLLQKSRAIGALRMIAHRLKLRFYGAPEDLELHSARRSVPGLDGVERGAGVAPVELLDPGTGRDAPQREVQRTLFIDLARMLEICRERGAALVLADYPVPIPETHATVNRYLRRFAQEADIPFVPLADRIVPLGETFGFPVMWFPDNHCTGDGNHEVARMILFELLDAGLVNEHETLRSVESFERRLRPPGLAIAQLDGNDVSVKVQGTPGHRFRIGVFVWLREGEDSSRPWQVNLVRAGLDDAQRKAYFGVLDEHGYAETTLRMPTEDSLQNMGEPGGTPFPKEAEAVRWQIMPFFLEPGAKLSEVRPELGADVPVESLRAQ